VGNRSLADRAAVGIRRVRNESKAIGKAYVRKMQSHQAQGQSHGNLRQPQAQAKAGMTGIDAHWKSIRREPG